MKYLISTLFIFSSLTTFAQNIFPNKLEGCNTSRFCLDCGNPKAGFLQEDFDSLLTNLNANLDFKGISGIIKFQVLVDSNGNGCVLSHTDNSTSPFTQQLITGLNDFNKWTPAVEDSAKVPNVSINVAFIIENKKITGSIERVDFKAFEKSISTTIQLKIENTDYQYANSHLKNYEFQVWDINNSKIPSNRFDYINIDKNNTVWISNSDGLLSLNGSKFQEVNKQKSAPNGISYFINLSTDNLNNKWAFGALKLCKYDDSKWTTYDTSVTQITGFYDIVTNESTNEVFVCHQNGISVYLDDQWVLINSSTIKEMHSDTVFYAKRDSKKRLWIGTSNGTVMVDELGKVTNFNDGESILKGKYIKSMAEDENGNLYFALRICNSKLPENKNIETGLLVIHPDGTMKQYKISNSGIPCNTIRKLLYDNTEKVLWISIADGGLVRYDLIDGWESYHNKNSEIPSPRISDMALDAYGNLYLTTWGGLVCVKKK